MKFKINNNNFKKIFIISFLAILLVSIMGTTLCIVLSKDDISSSWNGDRGNSFHSGNGSIDLAYSITNGMEFAYLVDFANANSTNDLYFTIDNDIYINDGVFEYNNNNIIYIKNGVRYYVKSGTYNYYSDLDYNNFVGTLNSIGSINNFNGFLDGNGHTIYGLYITSDDLYTYFINYLDGDINNIKFNNCFVYGNGVVSFINNANNSNVNSILFNGNIISIPNDFELETSIDSPIVLTLKSNQVSLNKPDVPKYSTFNSINISGSYSNIGFLLINDVKYNNNNFSIDFDSLVDSIKVSTNSSNSNYVIDTLIYNTNFVASYATFINNSVGSIIEKNSIKGYFLGNNLVCGVSCSVDNTSIINNYVSNKMNGSYYVVGISQDVNNSIINNNVVNGDIVSFGDVSSLVGFIYDDNSTINNNISNGIINGNNIYPVVIDTNNNVVNIINDYYTYDNIIYNTYGIHGELDNIIDYNFLLYTMNFSFNDSSWIFNDGLPYLYFDNISIPNFDIIVNDKVYNKDDDSKNVVYYYDDINVVCNYSDQVNLLKIEYYVSDIYSLDYIDDDDIEYEIYNSSLNYTDNGFYTIYFKVTDLYGNVGYFKSDLLIIDRYSVNINSSNSDVDLVDYDYQIDNNTKIVYSINRESDYYDYISGHSLKYYINSNINFINGMKFYFRDNINDLLYYYEVNDDTNMIDLSSFKLVGSVNDSYFNNDVNRYLNNYKYVEDFDLIVDFNSVNNNSNYLIQFVVMDSDNVISKIDISDNKSIDVIVKDSNGDVINNKINISTDFNSIINLSSIGSNNINIDGSLLYKEFNGNYIYSDNKYRNNLFLNILLVNGNDNMIVDKISYIYNDNVYYMDKYGYGRIPIEYDDVIDIDFDIVTNYVVNEYQNGSYNFKIWVSYGNVDSNILSIPASIHNDVTISKCKFDIKYNKLDQVFTLSNNKSLELDSSVLVDFIYDGDYSNSRVLVYLEKFNFNNNSYEVVNINDYLKNDLSISNINNKYVLINSITNDMSLSIDFNISSFSVSGYRLVFDLYDGDSFVKEKYMNIMVKR